jgi:quercetin dioxygenase-like cupin family protein
LKLMIAALLASMIPFAAQAEDTSSPIHTETLIQSTSSWDGRPYTSYPAGRPQITILKITIAPHTTLKWHSHPMPNAGYILSGELTVEKEDGTKRHFVAGQAITETVIVIAFIGALQVQNQRYSLCFIRVRPDCHSPGITLECVHALRTIYA